MQVLDVGLMILSVAEGGEVVGERTAETMLEDVVMGMSCEIAAEITSLELAGGHVVLGATENNLSELLEATEVALSPVSVSEVMAEDKFAVVSDLLVKGEEAVMVEEIPITSLNVEVASTERAPFCSTKADLVDRFVEVVETKLWLLGAQTVSWVVREGVVTCSEVVLTERLGVMDSEETEGTEIVLGGSVGEVVGKLEVGGSEVGTLGLGIEALLSGAVSLVGVVAAAGG